jgi:histidinol-phosphatase (PHP family)
LSEPDRTPTSAAALRGVVSLHTHSRYCDGQGEIADYVTAARAAGLAAFGASGHAPLPFFCDYAMPLATLDAYRADVQAQKAALRGSYPVWLGLELDYLPSLSDFYQRELRRRGFDYFVASVHYVGAPGAEPWAYDESEVSFARAIAERHGGDARPVVEDYYRRMIQMVREVSEWGMPIIVGHLDRVGLWNRDDRYFPTDGAWYQSMVDEVLDQIAASPCVLELNTGGWAKPVAAPNPSPAILRRAAARGIPILLGADAHRPDQVARLYGDGLRLLREAGYPSIVTLSEGRWQTLPLPSPNVEDAEWPNK